VSDTDGGDRRVRLHHSPPFDEDEGVTLQVMAKALGVDEESAMVKLIDAACHGWLECDLLRWRPRGEAES
jgi:hypothetical protein